MYLEDKIGSIAPGMEADIVVLDMKSTPIIGLSAHAMSGDADKAKQAGCNDYLTKPVDEDLLLKKLDQFLG